MAKIRINPPKYSKIVWTSAILGMLNMLKISGMIDAALYDSLVQTVNVIAPVLIAVFRIWFTEK